VHLLTLLADGKDQVLSLLVWFVALHGCCVF
jgi:hypothetical protein